MTVKTLFDGSPDDMQAMMAEALRPLVERIRALEIATGSYKHAYTVTEVAQRIGYSTKTIREFIRIGRRGRNGRTVTLRAFEITTGNLRVLPTDLDAFIRQF